MDIFQDYKTNINLKGIGQISVAAGQTETNTWICDGVYYLTGMEYCIDNYQYGDTATLEVFSPLDLVNPVYVFGEDVFLFDKQRYEFYKSELQAGIQIKISIKNNGSNNIVFYYNYILHQVN